MLQAKPPVPRNEAPLRAGLAGLGSGVVAFILYAATDHPQASHGDVAEFQTLAATGGIAHAGYPALVMALRAFGLLRWSSYAYRANLLSCFSAAIAVGLAGYAASRLAKSAAAGVGAAPALALSLTLWQDGTQAEIYVFTLAIAAGLFLVAVDFAERPSTRSAFSIGVLGGLGLVSHLSVLT